VASKPPDNSPRQLDTAEEEAMTIPHPWADRSEHEKRCGTCHTTVVRLFRSDGNGYDVQYFSPDGSQLAAAPDCTSPQPGAASRELPLSPFYVFARLDGTLADGQAAALRSELALSPAEPRSWHVNTDPAFASIRLDAGTMPGAEAAARPVFTEAFARAGLGAPSFTDLIAIPDSQVPAAVRREPPPDPIQDRLLEAG
jgi:hypothetical protein